MTGPLILITLGILFLLNNIDPQRFEFGHMWSVILIVIGLVKIFEYFGGSERPRRAGPGRHYRQNGGPRARRGAARDFRIRANR